jgi:hypothetical protein
MHSVFFDELEIAAKIPQKALVAGLISFKK